MSKFSEIWDTEVKKLAEACVTEPKFIRLLNVSKETWTDEEKKYMGEVMNKGYKDIVGTYYISDMISRVEHALADNRECQARMAILLVHNTITAKSYLEDVFEGDTSSEEWKGRVALREGLKKLIDLPSN